MRRLGRLPRALTCLLVAGVLILTGQTAPVGAVDTGDPQDPFTHTHVLPKRCLRGGTAMPARAGACHLTHYKGRRTIVVWGDSHAWQQLPAMIKQARSTRTNLVAFVMGSCPPMDLLGRAATGRCAHQARLAMKFIEKRASKGKHRPKVILGAFWSLYRDLYRRAQAGETFDDPRLVYVAKQAKLFHRTIKPLFWRLKGTRVHVAAIGPQPWVAPEARACPEGDQPYNCEQPREDAVLDEDKTTAWLKKRLSIINTSGVVPTARFTCGPNRCHPRLDQRYVYLDDLHLNPAVTRSFAPAYRRIFTS